jgi:acyl-CoA dehydrogenase
VVTGDLESRLSLARAAVPRLTELLAAEAASVDTEGAFPEAGLAALRDSGLLGLLVPVEHGGLSGTLTDLVQVAQELAGGCLSTAMIWAMHCQQVDTLVNFAGSELRERLLPRIARGEVYLASVTTEAAKGGHLLTSSAPLRESGERLALDRDAPVVTGGRHADGFLITMRASPEAAEHRVSLVYADRDQVALEFSGGWDTLGMRGTQSIGMRITGAVPTDQLVGPPGGFRTVAVEGMAAVGHLAWSACWLGAARQAFGDLVGLMRSPGGRQGVDVNSDLVAERIARARLDLELTSAYLNRVREEVERLRADGSPLGGASTQIHLNTLKVAAAELTFEAVDRLVQLSGLARGYRRDPDFPMERRFRDLRSASLNYANDRLLTVTGRLCLMDRSVDLA